MKTPVKDSPVHILDRFSLRLSQATLEAIDDARGQRAGNVSRNTWITEAIEEKLSRETDAKIEHDERQKTHG